MSCTSLEGLKEQIDLLNLKREYQEIGFFKPCSDIYPLTINKTKKGYILEGNAFFKKMNFEFNTLGRI